MAKTQSLTINQSHDDALTRKRIKTCDIGVVSHWSDLTQDVLFLVMMKLGVIDFVSFTGVCQSWRLFSLENGKKFMASKPPMSIRIKKDAYKNKSYLYLEDFERRRSKTVLPHAAGRTCIGVTCGYLVLFGDETEDLWLVNPITRHQIHFPSIPCSLKPIYYSRFRAILIFSPSSGWLLVITERYHDEIWFCESGKGVWNHVSTNSEILDLHAFKGKIYTLLSDYPTLQVRYLCEMTLGMDPKLILLETKNFPETPEFLPGLGNSDENLLLFEYISGGLYKVHQLDLDEMKSVYLEKEKNKYALYTNTMNCKTTSCWLAPLKAKKPGPIIQTCGIFHMIV